MNIPVHNEAECRENIRRYDTQVKSLTSMLAQVCARLTPVQRMHVEGLDEWYDAYRGDEDNRLRREAWLEREKAKDAYLKSMAAMFDKDNPVPGLR